jgi:glycine/D-amino acid oxidase-like deaminating enzyme
MEKGRRRWGETPWLRAEGLPRGNNTAPCDIAIVGGGLTGASTAYHLAKRGIRSTIFEAARIGDGASGRTGGIVLEGTAAGVLEEVDSCVAELEALVGEERIDCDLSLPGCWEIEHRASANDRMLERWRPAGMHHENSEGRDSSACRSRRRNRTRCGPARRRDPGEPRRSENSR